jgi:hypothetical protein
MTMLSLGEASRLVGVSKSTLSRAIKAGRMSAAARQDDGSYQLDPAEVLRCFPPPTGDDRNGGATPDLTQHATTDATAVIEAQHRAALAEARLADLKNMLTDMTAQRDAWQSQAQATQRMLTDASARRPWWKRLAG